MNYKDQSIENTIKESKFESIIVRVFVLVP